MPDAPTVREATGLAYATGVWWGVFAPARLPPALRATLHGAITEAVAEPGFQRVLIANGASAAPIPSEAFAAQLARDLQRWAEVARRAGVARP
ncbi:MAG: tripartite tricarboxylate transporter substrate-binding protein, partial [Roseococcus sp.]